jgi:hypothetical protein
MNTTTLKPDENFSGSVFPQRKAFVLRFSAEAGPQTGAFNGRVEHVSSGETAAFRSPDELWAFVRTELLRGAEPPLALPASLAERRRQSA